LRLKNKGDIKAGFRINGNCDRNSQRQPDCPDAKKSKDE
jgi:hypothetical protein